MRSSESASPSEFAKMVTNRNLQMKYLTDSKVILSSPGTLVSDIYYTKQNSTVDQVEVEYTSGKFKQSLSSKSFQSSAAVNIPNNSLIELMTLELTLPDLNADTCLPRGWGYMAIQRIDYTWGGCNIGNISINGHSLFQTVMTQCLTSEKKSQVLKLGGEEKLAPNGSESSATVILPLPWSSIQGLMAGKKKPYDSSILSDPIQVMIYFRSAKEIYGGSGVLPTEFTRATALLRQGDLSVKEFGLKTMVRLSGWQYVYPFLHRQSYTPEVTSANFQIALNLTTIIDADLLSIYIGVVKSSDEARTTDNTPNLFNYVELTDIQLLFNGAVLVDCPGRSHLIYQLSQTDGGTYYENSIVNAGTVGPFVSNPVNNNLFIYDSTRCRQENFEGMFANARKYGQQTMNFIAGVPEDATLYKVYVTYVYNGMSLTNSNGNMTIYYT